jgi:hypothetical protein
MHDQDSQKVAYNAPMLEDLGSLSEITAGGNDHPDPSDNATGYAGGVPTGSS